MTLKQLYAEIKKTKNPVAHYAFKSPTPPPFVVYLTPSRSNITADSRVAIRVQHIRVELYTTKKDAAEEQKIEIILNSLGTDYSVEEFAIDSENLYEVAYEFDINLTEV